MQMRNFVQPHMLKKECRKCGKLIPALVKGEIVKYPICDEDKAKEAAEFRKAQLAANRQSRKQHHVGK